MTEKQDSPDDSMGQEDTDFEEQPEKTAPAFCAKSLKAPLWIIGGLVVFVLLWAVIIEKDPTIDQVAQSWGEPEKSYKLLKEMSGVNSVPAASSRALTPLPVGAHWTISPPHIDRGSCHNCHPFTRGATGGRQGSAQAIAQAVLTPLPSNARRTVIPPHPERGPCYSCHSYSPKAAPVAGQVRSITIKEVGMAVADTSQGVFVTHVFGKSWAEKGGLEHGDIIYGFNHRRVGDVAKFQKLVAAASPEKRHTFKVFRDGKRTKLNVMIGEGEMEGVVMPTQGKLANAVPGQTVGMGRTGGYGLGPGGYIVCPNCGFKMLHQRSVPAYSIQCPKCATPMVREELMSVQGVSPRPAGQPVNLGRGQGVSPWWPTGR